MFRLLSVSFVFVFFILENNHVCDGDLMVTIPQGILIKSWRLNVSSVSYNNHKTRIHRNIHHGWGQNVVPPSPQRSGFVGLIMRSIRAFFKWIAQIRSYLIFTLIFNISIWMFVSCFLFLVDCLVFCRNKQEKAGLEPVPVWHGYERNPAVGIYGAHAALARRGDPVASDLRAATGA